MGAERIYLCTWKLVIVITYYMTIYLVQSFYLQIILIFKNLSFFLSKYHYKNALLVIREIYINLPFQKDHSSECTALTKFPLHWIGFLIQPQTVRYKGICFVFFLRKANSWKGPTSLLCLLWWKLWWKHKRNENWKSGFTKCCSGKAIKDIRYRQYLKLSICE